MYRKKRRGSSLLTNFICFSAHPIYSGSYMAGNSIGTFETCNLLHVILYGFYLFPSLTIIELLALMTLHRYYVITNQTKRWLICYKRNCVIAVILINVFLGGAITFEMYELFFKSQTSTSCTLVFNRPQRQCRFDSVLNPCFTPITDFVATVTITGSSLVISGSTRKLKAEITKVNKTTHTILGLKRKINFRRIKATHILWISYTVLWVPWGVTRLTFAFNINPTVSQLLNDFSQTLSLSVYLAIPGTYFLMDSQFPNYIKSTLQKPFTGRSLQTNAINSVSQEK